VFASLVILSYFMIILFYSTYSNRNDHPDMIIGQATLGIEIFEQITDFDVLILPTMIDGCGITAGIAVAVRDSNPNIKIIVSEHTYTQVIFL